MDIPEGFTIAAGAVLFSAVGIAYVLANFMA